MRIIVSLAAVVVSFEIVSLEHHVGTGRDGGAAPRSSLHKNIASEFREIECFDGPAWTPPPKKAEDHVTPPPEPAADVPPFYLYGENDGPEFSLGPLGRVGQEARRDDTKEWQQYVRLTGSAIQHRAALFFLEALNKHPQRQMKASQASLLVVPMLDPQDWYFLVPRRADKRDRLDRLIRSRTLLAALVKSEHFRTRGQHHVILHGNWCAWALCRGAELTGLATLYRAGATVGALDRFFYGSRQAGLAAWRARAPGATEAEVHQLYEASTVLVPYVSAQQFSTEPPGARSSFIFEGRKDRREGGQARVRLGDLAAKLPGARICFTKSKLDKGGMAETYAAPAVAASAAAMRGADACFVPAGDTPTSSRLYSALAAGCVPVLLVDDADKEVLPFHGSIDWDSIAIVRPTLNATTDLDALAADLRGRDDWARRRARGRDAFSKHLDYVGNARGVANAFLREVAVARRARHEILSRAAWRAPTAGDGPAGLGVVSGAGAGPAGGCPKVALLLGHARSGTTRLEELVFRRAGVHLVDEPMAAFQDLAPSFPEAVEVSRLFKHGGLVKAYDLTARLLACEQDALRLFMNDPVSRSRQLRHAVDAAALGPATARVRACAAAEKKAPCFKKEAWFIAAAWANACRRAPVRAAKEVRLNGAVGVQLLTEVDLLASLATRLGCAPRVFVLHLVRHPVDTIISNGATSGLNGVGGHGLTTLRMRGPRDLPNETLARAEAETMCHQTLLDLESGAVLDRAPKLRTKGNVVSARAARKVVRYQDMVRDPGAVQRDVAAWLGLPEAPEGAPAWAGPTLSVAFSTERRDEDFAYGKVCDDRVPAPWVYSTPSCALLIADLGLERVCALRGNRDSPSS